MLIKCPECELQVSDKAVFCPHCGYPFQNKTKNPTRGKSRMRLPNGFGQITKISSKPLRNPWRVMVHIGTDPNTGRPKQSLLKPKAYFASYNEAYQALVEYNRNPFDLADNTTLLELYERWFKEHFSEDTSPNTISYTKTIWNNCTTLYYTPIRNIRTRDIRECIESADTTPIVKKRMKYLLQKLFDYAITYELTDRNYAKEYKLPENLIRESSSVKEQHKAFCAEEIQELWRHRDDYTARMILVQIFMGWRPEELCKLEAKNIKDGFICGGSKTDSGKNRIVPIHPYIADFIRPQGKYIFGGITYAQYYTNFGLLMNKLHFTKHRPHDPRKTFVTLAKEYKVDEYAIKRIVGHKISDVTEAIYTERSPEWLREEILKIKIPL